MGGVRRLGLLVLVGAQTISALAHAAPPFELRALGGDGLALSGAAAQVSLQRAPPERLGDDPYAPSTDSDALRFVVIGESATLPATLDVRSLDEDGAELDRLKNAPLAHVPCPADVAAGRVCGSTLPLRAVTDDIDRDHPTGAGRSLRSALGGAWLVLNGGDTALTLRVGGPRKSALGPIGRHRAHLRAMLVRSRASGTPPFGDGFASAIALAREEIGRATGLWSACGISFGPPAELDVRLVDAPPSHLVAVGCELGLPASGGLIRFNVEGHTVSLETKRGELPAEVARRLALAVEKAGTRAVVSDNVVVSAGAFGSSDVLLRKPNGDLADATPTARSPLSSDPTMRVCIGRVELDDGLQHFGDGDAIAGTLEERTLLKAFDDGDPSTIEVYFIPGFGGGGRIGESFIYADGGAIRNAVIEDRAGLRADRASFALAHELGHVLLDEPGHPDDFGIDTPTRLMDADSVSASAFGPRRLLIDECVRALRQSGAGTPSGLLAPWPLAPLP
jgi:hypothetical protein